METVYIVMAEPKYGPDPGSDFPVCFCVTEEEAEHVAALYNKKKGDSYWHWVEKLARWNGEVI